MGVRLLRSRTHRWRIAKALAGLLPLTWRRHLLYAKHYRRWPNLKDPIRFSEKMQWRVIQDRSSLLIVMCDKMKAYEYARSVAEQDGLRLHIPRVLSFSTELDTFIGDLQRLHQQGELPRRFVIKPNHGSGQVLAVEGAPDWSEIRQLLIGWISDTNYSGLRWVWGYSQARHGLIAEEYIGGIAEPLEWQAWMFNGEPAAYLLKQRNDSGFSRANYDPQWQRLPPWNNTDRDWLDVSVPPTKAAEVLQIAKALSAGWSHLRVDLYVDASDQIWIGELTAYSQEGLLRASEEADDFDQRLGRLWQLP